MNSHLRQTRIDANPGYTEFIVESLQAHWFTKDDNGRFYVTAYTGQRIDLVFSFIFSDEYLRNKEIINWVIQLKAVKTQQKVKS